MLETQEQIGPHVASQGEQLETSQGELQTDSNKEITYRSFLPSGEYYNGAKNGEEKAAPPRCRIIDTTMIAELCALILAFAYIAHMGGPTKKPGIADLSTSTPGKHQKLDIPAARALVTMPLPSSSIKTARVQLGSGQLETLTSAYVHAGFLEAGHGVTSQATNSVLQFRPTSKQPNKDLSFGGAVP